MQARDTVSGFHCLVLTLMSSLKYKRLVLHQFPGRGEGEGGGGGRAPVPVVLQRKKQIKS